MRRIKNWAVAAGLSRFLLMWAVVGLGCASPNAAHAGGCTVYIANLAQLNYKTPVYYDKIFPSGSGGVYTTSSACLQNISDRVNNNKRYGTDYESYFVIYTERNPARYLPDGGGTLAHIARGKWEGWIIYWVPARNRGRFWNPLGGESLGTILVHRLNDHLAVTPAAHYRVSPMEFERDLVYIVQTPTGQLTLTADEFEHRFGWKNDPETVRLDRQP